MSAPIGEYVLTHLNPKHQEIIVWIMLTNSFLSIVQKGPNPELLLVRARRRGDIERVFSDASVNIDHKRDYRFRATLPRPFIASSLAAQVRNIDYTNFKASVGDERLHLAYLQVWKTMAGLQT